MKKQTKETILILILVIICCMGGKAQDKALLEYNAGTKKVYFHDPETNKHLELFRDTLNEVKIKGNDTTTTQRLTKYYVIQEGKKNFAVFRRTPEKLIFDYIYGKEPGEQTPILIAGK